MVERYLRNLSELILKRMETGNYTISRFADECGVSARKISDIKNRKVKNIKLETLVKICETHQFSYIDIFDCQDESEQKLIESVILNFFLTDGRSKFIISKIK